MRDFVNVVGYNAHKEHLADMLTQVGRPDCNAAFTPSEPESESETFICSVPLINMNSTLNFHGTHQKATLWARCKCCPIRVRLYSSESDIASRWVHRESNLMFTLSSDKDETKKFTFAFVQCMLTSRVKM